MRSELVASRDLVLMRVERHVFGVRQRIEIAEPSRSTLMDVLRLRSSVDRRIFFGKYVGNRCLRPWQGGKEGLGRP